MSQAPFPLNEKASEWCRRNIGDIEMRAKLLKTGLLKGNANLYELDPPLEGNKFVIVSAVNAFGMGDETYIFPATEKGEVIDYGELEGSFQGDQDHERALNNAGYKIV
jgi:hypothetical protein